MGDVGELSLLDDILRETLERLRGRDLDPAVLKALEQWASSADRTSIGLDEALDAVRRDDDATG